MENHIRTALQELLNQAMQQGGMTLCISNGEPEAVSMPHGYQVALENNIVESINSDKVLEALWDKMQENAAVQENTGIWVDAFDNLYIEQSTYEYDYDRAMALGLVNGQQYIWDWENLEEIAVDYEAFTKVRKITEII